MSYVVDETNGNNTVISATFLARLYSGCYVETNLMVQMKLLSVEL